jgi:hypothetical protein
MVFGQFLPLLRRIEIALMRDFSGSRALRREGKESLDFSDLTPYRCCLYLVVSRRIVQLTEFLQAVLQILRESPPRRGPQIGGDEVFHWVLGMKKAADIAVSGLVGCAIFRAHYPVA